MDIYQNNKHINFWTNYKLNIIYAGDAQVGNDWVAKNVCSSFSRIYYITQGEGYISLENETIKITKGNIYVIPAGLKYNYYCETSMSQIFFHVNVIHQSGLDLLQGSQSIYRQSFSAEKLELIQKLYHSERIEDSFRLVSILWEKIAEFIEENDVREKLCIKYSALIEAVFQLAQNPVNINKNVTYLANQLHVSVSTLGKQFRRETRMTPSAYLHQLIINKACYLLHTEDYSIAGIAEELGFRDQFYFTKYFKRHMQVSPSTYRNQLKMG